MAYTRVKLDRAGIGRILKEQCRGPIDALAAQVAAKVDARGKPVEVRSYTTDRAAASVSIAHPAGLAIQAKYGALTRAAAAVGLEVRSRGDGLVEYVSKAGKKSRITSAQAANYGRKSGG